MNAEQIATLERMRDEIALLCDELRSQQDQMGIDCAQSRGPAPSREDIHHLATLVQIGVELAALLARVTRG